MAQENKGAKQKLIVHGDIKISKSLKEKYIIQRIDCLDSYFRCVYVHEYEQVKAFITDCRLPFSDAFEPKRISRRFDSVLETDTPWIIVDSKLTTPCIVISSSNYVVDSKLASPCIVISSSNNIEKVLSCHFWKE